eukprot:scaffold29290_cov153-Isochrysis_galbana.AAC.3
MKQRLLVAHGGKAGAALCFFPAQHPRTSGRIMLGLRGEELLEVHHAGSNAQASWLLGGLECAIQDGAIFFATPIDPLFLLLPLLEKARGAAIGERRGLFKPLSDIFTTDDATLEARLASLPGLNEKLVREQMITRPADYPSLARSRPAGSVPEPGPPFSPPGLRVQPTEEKYLLVRLTPAVAPLAVTGGHMRCE